MLREHLLFVQWALPPCQAKHVQDMRGAWKVLENYQHFVKQDETFTILDVSILEECLGVLAGSQNSHGQGW